MSKQMFIVRVIGYASYILISCCKYIYFTSFMVQGKLMFFYNRFANIRQLDMCY